MLKAEEDPPDLVYLGIQTETGFIKLLTSFVVLKRETFFSLGGEAEGSEEGTGRKGNGVCFQPALPCCFCVWRLVWFGFFLKWKVFSLIFGLKF